ncbi:hypothetical protein [Natrinema versiforme]|uniref:CARDB domain-containing protein n=1 Tax=Natrinema versiforme JCM 10478 TaxID=1227496 RepID=L9XXJ5_9EURY|nr:hypothetical protein [Natrinema versiforme]ELY66539.1 hypothetical protein C489_12869 [Natrinema versiforme JCM 10478]
MQRRTFIGVSSAGLGLAGCLNAEFDDSDAEAEPESGNETGETTDESFSDANSLTSNGSKSEGDSNANESEGGSDDAAEDDDTDTESGNSEQTVSFPSCTRAELTGTFEAGDVAFASTGFYDDGLYGNTMLEDGFVFGEDVDAPFSGTVVFEIGSDAAVREGDGEITVEIPAYGSDGTVISGLATEEMDYRTGGTTHGNPNAQECLSEIEPDETGDGSDGGTATFSVTALETTTPVDAGDFLEVSATVENTGGAAGTQDLALIVGHSAERVEEHSVTLEAGEQTGLTTGYRTPPVDADQEFPIRIESDDDAAERTVLVYGTN